MCISEDICISKILYKYKISAHIFFKPFLIYMYKESFEKYIKTNFGKKNSAFFAWYCVSSIGFM